MRLVTVVLATSYAPVGNAKEHIRHAFAEDMERLMEVPKSNEVLLDCIDANASMGTRSLLKSRVRLHGLQLRKLLFAPQCEAIRCHLYAFF